MDEELTGSDLTFVVGRQRSGTTVLRKFFESHGALDCGEILSETFDQTPPGFYEFLLQHVREVPGDIHPLRHEPIFEAYVEHLRELAKGAPLVIDLKYFAFNLIPRVDDLHMKLPIILHYLRRKKANVIHLIRRNKLRAIVSEEMSKQTGIWAASRVEELPRQRYKLNLDLQFVHDRIAELERLDREITEFLSCLPQVRRIHYDELFTDGVFSDAACTLLRQCMGVEVTDRRPAAVKMNPEPLEDLVENMGEIAIMLAETDWAWMVHGEEAPPYVAQG